MKKIFTPLVFLIISNIFSQNVLNCGTDEYWQNMIRIHPEISANNLLINEKIESRLSLRQKSSSEPVYYIPVVFHVVYDTPSKNISDTVLINALNYLNDYFRKRNNITTVYPLFQNLVADCKIEIFNLQGASIFKRELVKVKRLKIDLSHIQSGVYLIKIKPKNELVITKKLIKL